MTLFAGITDFTPQPGTLIAWVVAGVITGFITGCVLRGGYGVVADVGAGLAGATLGGFVFEPFAEGDAGFWRGIIAAFLGACVVLSLVRFIAYKRPWN